MKIVVAGTRGIPEILGGVETHCEQLYPHLVQMGCNVTLIRRSCYVKDHLKTYKGVCLKDIYAPKNKSLEAIVHSFLAVIHARKLKADILHIHSIGPSLVVPFARMLGLKVVVTHHGPDYDRQKWNKFAKSFLKLGERFGVKYSNELIVISEVINEIVREKYRRSNAHLIYNGVISPVKATTSEFIESLGLEKNNYILSVGRFVPEKGLDLLINAFSQLGNADIKLVLAGDADHETDYSLKLKQEAEKKGIILTGFITGDKLNEIYSHASLFVLPSYHEGLPIALLEAMSYNLDVLVSNIPANMEVKLPKTSYFESGDHIALMNGIKGCLKKQSGARPVYDMSEYDWSKIAARVMNVYSKIMVVKREK